MPSPTLSPREAVTVQLQAISNNDHPWQNHGVQTLYEFAEDCGSMERSRYFGFSKDLYHFDHFLGAFKTACGPLVDCSAFTLLDGPPGNPAKPLEPLGPGVEAVYVAVTDSRGGDGGVFELTLVQRQVGLKAGCWMTKSCLRVT